MSGKPISDAADFRPPGQASILAAPAGLETAGIDFPSATRIEPGLAHLSRVAEVGVAAHPSGFTDGQTNPIPHADLSIPFSVPAPRREQLTAGQRMGGYRVVQKLGEGGMGAVYKAERLDDGQVVAIKVLSSLVVGDPQAVRRFQKEARLLAAVNNPYVAGLLEVGEDEGRHYLVMEFVAGTSLKQYLAERGALEEHEALAIMADVARALVDPHEQGIVHRDIKPDNIILAIVGSEPRQEAANGTRTDWLNSRPQVKLLDFGIAQNRSIGIPLHHAGGRHPGNAELHGARTVQGQRQDHAANRHLFDRRHAV